MDTHLDRDALIPLLPEGMYAVEVYALDDADAVNVYGPIGACADDPAVQAWLDAFPDAEDLIDLDAYDKESMLLSLPESQKRDDGLVVVNQFAPDAAGVWKGSAVMFRVA